MTAASCPGRTGAALARWAACLALALVVLLAPLVALGVSARTLAATFAYGLLFLALPGLGLLATSRFMAGNPIAFAAWCLAAGLALQPLWLTPLWMAGRIDLAWLVPVAGIALVAHRRRALAAYLASAMQARAGKRLAANTCAIAAFTALSACLGVMFPFATVPLDAHFGTQGSIVRNLMDGWPPMNQLFEGAPLSYNYGVHLGLMLLVQLLHADIVQVVARVAPFVLLEAAIVVFLAYGRDALRLPWRALLAAAIAAFWVIGFGPVNGAIYGSVLPSSSTYVFSSTAAFVVFLLGLHVLGSPPARGWTAAAVGAALAFSITALRGQGGPVWIAVLAFACVLPLARERRLDARAAWMLAGATVGLLAALRIFFTLGVGFSGTSFLRVNTTFGWLAQQESAFSLVHALKERGVQAWLAGAIGFAVIALMQAKFLAPALAWELARLRPAAARPVLLLAATAFAGTMATLLTSSPGGSHFSFLHYAALAMALLAGSGFAALTAARPRGRQAALILALVAALAVPSAWDLGVQLRRMRGRWLAGPPVLHALPDVDPLLRAIPERSVLLPLVHFADHPHGIESEWGMRYGLRFALYPPLLTEYAGWENRLQPVIRRRLAASARIERSLEARKLPIDEVATVAATLSHPQPLYVIIGREVAVPADPRLRALASTRAYTLYSFQPAAGPSGA